ncbi:Integrase core domain protein [Aquisphaera giovannonii]|uniref:Integrase core domain protein n=1 Tax=Aquisphaera giovannonii TaxID=406548 RepID=A0A5B9W5C7_9BACT|nr:IS481 family transposase [Aquisphaera giovannonii]QEH35027.1 Integrase core domain protein [Aquisphaera giovannonii]QEH35394.1 Integrase core domain protein [Aquisphaera giovannonii]
MPWKDVSLMSQRLEFVALAAAEGANVRELCRRFAISPKTAYKWIARHRDGGDDALADRPRRPASSPARCPGDLEAAVLRLRDDHPAWGGRKLRARLAAMGMAAVPAASTITAILRRHGRLDPAASAAATPWVRFEHDAPNRLWQMDFKGHFAAGAGRCHPLTILDDHSRYAVGLYACGDQREATVRRLLEATFRAHGLPERILCDNGSPWGPCGGEARHTGLTVWLLRLGVGVSHGRPFHPQTQGKDERFHRTLKAEVIQGRAFRDLEACRSGFEAWRETYNHRRPHEALGLAVPASRYRMSERPYPEAPPSWEYGPGDAVRKVACDGTISFRGRRAVLGKAFRGERVAVRPADADGSFGVYFGVHRVAGIDLRAHNDLH